MLLATCINNTSFRIDKPEPPTGLTHGKTYEVAIYNQNADNNQRPPMVRFRNDNGQMASYTADRFKIEFVG
ncbi:hypothetical protein VPHD479_0171 [Vibrio phage D479]